MTTEIKIAALEQAIKYKEHMHYTCVMPLLEIVAVFEAYLTGDTTQAVELMDVMQKKVMAIQLQKLTVDEKSREFIL